MKTVQTWLNKVDETELIDAYFAEFPIDYKMIADKKLTLGEIQDHARERLTTFIDRMKICEIDPEKDACVFFACKEYREGYENIGIEMCQLEDIRTQEHPQCYSWLFVDFGEVMGYFIADTELTQKNICSVLAQILYEMSFFGYTQEDMEKERRKTEKACEEAERGECYTEDEVWERFGFNRPEPDPKAERLKRKIHAAEHAYCDFCREREIAEIKRLLG